MMHMTLYWGIDVNLLFDSWKTDSWPSYLLSLLACFLFSSFFQYMESRRFNFKTLAAADVSLRRPSHTSSAAVPLLPSAFKLRRFSSAKIGAALLFGFNSAIGYLLMLAIMSFNGGVFLAIVVGLSVGYFLFRDEDERVVIVEDPCACS